MQGRVCIDIDPYFCKERLLRMQGMPSLFVDWRVTRIQQETTPWIESAATDAWTDDGGGADYLLSLSI